MQRDVHGSDLSRVRVSVLELDVAPLLIHALEAPLIEGVDDFFPGIGPSGHTYGLQGVIDKAAARAHASDRLEFERGNVNCPEVKLPGAPPVLLVELRFEPWGRRFVDIIVRRRPFM